MPQFNFQGIPEHQAQFQQTAYVLENTGVHAYLGQLTNIRTPAYLAAAGSIALIEGRHAAVIGSIINDTPNGIAPNGPFDTPETAADPDRRRGDWVCHRRTSRHVTKPEHGVDGALAICQRPPPFSVTRRTTDRWVDHRAGIRAPSGPEVGLDGHWHVGMGITGAA
jgi:hypothetical protein